MSNYCDYDDIGILMSKTYDATTTPTATQVTTLCTQVTNEIDVILSVIGISAQPTDTNILGMLKKYSSFGAAGVLGITYARQMSAPDTEKAKWYYEKFEKFLEMLRSDPEMLGITADSESISASNLVIDGTYSEDEVESLIVGSGEFEV